MQSGAATSGPASTQTAVLSLLGARSSGPSSGNWSASPAGISPYVSRRLLELLTTLARHQTRLASEAVSMGVPGSDSFVGELAARQDRKGKGKAREAGNAREQQQRGLEVVLDLLGKGMCRRSNAHLEQALHLLDVLLQSAKVGGPTHTHARTHNAHTPMQTGLSLLLCVAQVGTCYQLLDVLYVAQQHSW